MGDTKTYSVPRSILLDKKGNVKLRFDFSYTIKSNRTIKERTLYTYLKNCGEYATDTKVNGFSHQYYYTCNSSTVTHNILISNPSDLNIELQNSGSTFINNFNSEFKRVVPAQDSVLLTTTVARGEYNSTKKFIVDIIIRLENSTTYINKIDFDATNEHTNCLENSVTASTNFTLPTVTVDKICLKHKYVDTSSTVNNISFYKSEYIVQLLYVYSINNYSDNVIVADTFSHNSGSSTVTVEPYSSYKTSEFIDNTFGLFARNTTINISPSIKSYNSLQDINNPGFNPLYSQALNNFYIRNVQFCEEQYTYFK